MIIAIVAQNADSAGDRRSTTIDQIRITIGSRKYSPVTATAPARGNSVIGASGGLAGLVRWLEKFARGRRSTQFTTAVMGLILFIDDYANAGLFMDDAVERERIRRTQARFEAEQLSVDGDNFMRLGEHERAIGASGQARELAEAGAAYAGP